MCIRDSCYCPKLFRYTFICILLFILGYGDMGVFYKSIISSSGYCLLLLSSKVSSFLLSSGTGIFFLMPSGFLGFLHLLRNFRNTSPLLVDLVLLRVSFPFIYPHCGFGHILLFLYILLTFLGYNLKTLG